MSVKVSPVSDPFIEYPESDGKPLAENTKQLRWIVVFYGNLCGLFRARPEVFVAADLFWYPVQGRPDIRVAPDILVVFGRPKGDRPSYKQWVEENVPLTVVFEILSPGNTVAEMDDKLIFYETHGVDEYYIYDPDANHLIVYLRNGDCLQHVRVAESFASPRLGIRFDLTGQEMVVYRPDNRRFLSFEELEDARDQAEKRAGQAEKRAGQAEKRAGRLAELSRKARRGLASAEELQELEQLEETL